MTAITIKSFVRPHQRHIRSHLLPLLDLRGAFLSIFFIVVVWLRECFSDSFGLLVGLIIDLQFILAAFVQQSPRVSSLAEHRTDCQAEGGEQLE